MKKYLECGLVDRKLVAKKANTEKAIGEDFDDWWVTPVKSSKM